MAEIAKNQLNSESVMKTGKPPYTFRAWLVSVAVSYQFSRCRLLFPYHPVVLQFDC